jgi:restriction system protein
MAIPDYQTFMLPLLKRLSDGREWVMKEVTAVLAEEFRLTDAERQERLPSGQSTKVQSRVGWAKTNLKSAGLVEQPSRGRVRITPLGIKLLGTSPLKIDNGMLAQFPQFREFWGGDSSVPDSSATVESETTGEAPEETMASAMTTLNKALQEELLAKLKSCSPAFFERAVVKLLVAMGYGGITGDGLVTGQSGDGGLDGIIREDKLGLDIVGVQAKRWEGTVSRPTVQQFVGALDMVKAKKGVILTTSGFSREARDFVALIEAKKVVLIDGPRLAELMIQHGVGVTTVQTYEVKQLSGDFFEEDEG